MLFSPSHACLPLPVLLYTAEAAATGRDTTLLYNSLRVTVMIAVACEIGIGRGVGVTVQKEGMGRRKGG